jgi:uncharacterized membrane protein
MKVIALMTHVLGFSDLLLGALLTGAMFGVWLLFDPENLSAAAYLQQQQRGMRTLDPPLPILGGATILLTVLLAASAAGNSVRFAALLAAVGCYVAAGLITRLINQPINSVMRTWAPETLPANWIQYREKWWRWHIVRTSAAIAGLCLLIGAEILT